MMWLLLAGAFAAGLGTAVALRIVADRRAWRRARRRIDQVSLTQRRMSTLVAARTGREADRLAQAMIEQDERENR